MAKVVGILAMELKPGVDGVDYEKFFLEELKPNFDVSGFQIFLLKGNRGERDGKYAVMTVFDSVEKRDELVPSTGGRGGDWQKWIEDHSELFAKMETFREISGFTDYVQLG